MIGEILKTQVQIQLMIRGKSDLVFSVCTVVDGLGWFNKESRRLLELRLVFIYYSKVPFLALGCFVF